MKISFIAGLTLGTVGTAYALKKMSKRDSLSETCKKAVKKKIIEVLD